VKKTVFVAAAALAVSVMTAPVALAQEAGPGTQACIDATAALKDGQERQERLEKAVKSLEGTRAKVAVLAETYGIPFDVNTVNANDVESAISFLRRLRDQAQGADQTERVEQLNREMDIVKALRDAINEHQQASEARQAVNLADLAASQKTACDEADPGPTPSPTPTPTPTEEPEPSEEPEPDPNFVDLDCKDFPLADGRTAQQILNETPNDDPHGLDADKDRIACEPGQDTAADSSSDFADSGEVVSGRVARPSGGVSTGVGPA